MYKSKYLNMKNFLLLIIALILVFSPFEMKSQEIKQKNETQEKAASGGEMTFTIRTVTSGGNFSPRHVLAIWVEDSDGFIKTRKAMANQRKQYLYTWKAASNYNVVDAITGSTLTSHQTHTVSWDFVDLDGNIVPDGEYTVWVEFTEQHAQGPIYTLTFEKGPNPISLTPADETYYKDIEFEFTPLVADFTMDATAICQWESVTFTDESVNATSWEWAFGDGAEPATATGAGPHTVSYTTPGAKTISLTINGSLTETKENAIVVNPSPESDFQYSGSDFTIDFINLSQNATSYLWDFGDGNTSTEENPQHVYTGAGTFMVSLTAQYEDCTDEQTQEINLPIVGIRDNDNLSFTISPNPSEGKFFVTFNPDLNQDASLTIFNSQGKEVQTIGISNNPNVMIDLSNQVKGLYFVSLKDGKTTYSSKVLIK